jgi:hypothetical protein
MKDEAIEYVKSFFMDVDEAFLYALKTLSTKAFRESRLRLIMMHQGVFEI